MRGRFPIMGCLIRILAYLAHVIMVMKPVIKGYLSCNDSFSWILCSEDRFHCTYVHVYNSEILESKILTILLISKYDGTSCMVYGKDTSILNLVTYTVISRIL